MSGEQTKTTAMDEGVERLRGQLHDAVELIRRSGGGVVFERFPGALEEEPQSEESADEVVAKRVGTASTASAHRSLIDAADDLAETLAQLEGTAWRVHALRPGRGTP